MSTVKAAGSPVKVASLLLTDDEVIAIAARSERTWPSATPTVRVDDEPSVRASVNRGIRSLYARQLFLDNRGNLSPDIAEIDTIITRENAILGSYLSSKDFTYDPRYASTAHYSVHDTQFVSEVTTPYGLHHIRSTSLSECHDMVGSLLLAAQEFIAEEDDSGAKYLCAVGRPMEDGTRLVAAREGETSAWQVRAENNAIDFVGSIDSPEMAVDYLLGRTSPGSVGADQR